METKEVLKEIELAEIYGGTVGPEDDDCIEEDNVGPDGLKVQASKKCPKLFVDCKSHCGTTPLED